MNKMKFDISLPEDLHPATKSLVICFADALGEKLREAEIKYGYNNGWCGDDWEVECREKLYKHLEKGDPRDVAAFCAFMWHHGWSTYFGPAAVESSRPSPERARVDGYLGVINRLEPELHMIDAGTAYASAAISLKRIADALQPEVRTAESRPDPRGEAFDDIAAWAEHCAVVADVKRRSTMDPGFAVALMQQAADFRRVAADLRSGAAADCIGVLKSTASVTAAAPGSQS